MPDFEFYTDRIPPPSRNDEFYRRSRIYRDGRDDPDYPRSQCSCRGCYLEWLEDETRRLSNARDEEPNGAPCSRCGLSITARNSFAAVGYTAVGDSPGERFCYSCYRRYLTCCYRCERIFARAESMSGPNICWECTPIEDGTEFAIREWNYRPRPNFFGEGRVFLGMELEVEAESRQADARMAYDALHGLGYVKEDGSINYGFEIVTHPMTHEYMSTSFPWEMLSELYARGCHTRSDVGIHIHVNRDAFDGPVHIFRWLKLIYRNSNQIIRVARRHSRQWAPFTDGERVNAKKYAKGNREADRYTAVNVTNEKTFEVRVFASSLVAQEVRAAFDLVAASVEYTRNLTVPEIVSGGWEWDRFIRWAESQGDKYTALVKENGVQV